MIELHVTRVDWMVTRQREGWHVPVALSWRPLPQYRGGNQVRPAKMQQARKHYVVRTYGPRSHV